MATAERDCVIRATTNQTHKKSAHSLSIIVLVEIPIAVRRAMRSVLLPFFSGHNSFRVAEDF